jgi:hypothetical protein
MNFKEFITESLDESMPGMPGIDSETKQKLNLLLLIELEKPVLTIEAGMSKIRKILYLEGIAFESFSDLEEEGDEIATQLNDADYLYILYFPTDDGYYDFYAEVTDENGIIQAMSETEGEETD